MPAIDIDLRKYSATNEKSSKCRIEKDVILHSLNIREFYSCFFNPLPASKSGGWIKKQVLCPFHDDRTPNLSINTSTGAYHCFSCGASGDVFKFLMQLQGIDFNAACERLAEIAGISQERFESSINQIQIKKKQNERIKELERRYNLFENRMIYFFQNQYKLIIDLIRLIKNNDPFDDRLKELYKDMNYFDGVIHYYIYTSDETRLRDYAELIRKLSHGNNGYSGEKKK